MTHPRKVRMRTQVRTAHTLSCLLRRGAQPRLSGGAHGAQRHRRVRTPSAHLGGCRGPTPKRWTGEGTPADCAETSPDLLPLPGGPE